jgi:type IV pilus assembly protein PilE
MRTYKGFTLIELVVTMLIAAILAAVAIPAYSNYVRKSHRTDAKNALLDLASLEERFFSTNYVYSTDLSQLGYAASAAASVNVGNGYYTVTAPTVVVAVPPTATTTGAPATYSIKATAINDQFKDLTCRTFTVNSDGTRSSTDSTTADSTSSCW